jgi:hypothetical protein
LTVAATIGLGVAVAVATRRLLNLEARL